MRIFRVPFDIKREEKIFGGYLSLRQVIYLMLSASSFLIFITAIPKIIKIALVSTICILFLLCAFLKISEQNFDKLLFYWLKYIFREKNFIYERCNKWK